jgi:nitrogen regulatory protein P-II 1
LTRLVLLNISTDTNRIYLFPCPIHYTLKRLDMIVPHERVRDIAEILHKHKVGGLTMYDTMGRGLTRQEPLSVGRGVIKYIPEYRSNTKIEVLVPDHLAEPIVNDVLAEIGTGTSSIGKIFVFDVEGAYGIGTKQTGDPAL